MCLVTCGHDRLQYLCRQESFTAMSCSVLILYALCIFVSRVLESSVKQTIKYNLYIHVIH